MVGKKGSDRKDTSTTYGKYMGLCFIPSRLLDNNESLERGGRKLNIGQRLLAETEGVGAAVLEDLSRQRETLQNARAKVIAYLRLNTVFAYVETKECVF